MDESSILDNAPDGILLVAASGAILRASSAVSDMSGYSRDELVGQPVEVLIPPEYRSLHPRLRTAALESGYARPMGSSLTVELQHKSGARLPVDVAIRPVVDSDGAFFVIAIRDDTHRRSLAQDLHLALDRAKSAERESALAAARLGAAFDHAPLPMALLDEYGLVVHSNDAAREFAGDDVNASLGLVAQEWFQRSTDHDDETPRPNHEFEGWLITSARDAHGRVRDVATVVVAVDPPQPSMASLLTVRDVTDTLAATRLAMSHAETLAALARAERATDHVDIVDGFLHRWLELHQPRIHATSAFAVAREHNARVRHERRHQPDTAWQPGDTPRPLPVLLCLTQKHSGAAGALELRLHRDAIHSVLRTPEVRAAVALSSIAISQVDQHKRESDASAQIRWRSELLDAAGQAIIATDAPGRIAYWNRAAEDLLCGPPAQALGRQVDQVVNGLTRPDLDTRMDVLHGEGVLRRRDGSTFPAVWTWSPHTYAAVESSEAAPTDGSVVVITDVTDLWRARDAALTAARTDTTTGLPNRLALTDRLAANNAVTSIMVVAVDRFDAINDGHGHSWGDKVVVSAAERLARWGGSVHPVYRIDGATFAITCSCPTRVTPASHATDVRALFDEPILNGTSSAFVSCSIGVAYRGRRHSSSALLTEASAAAHHAAALGGGMIEVYNRGMRTRARNRLRAEDRLRHALRDGQLRLHFQPQHSLHDGSITGTEALVRWDQGEGKIVSPADFLGVAEESGLIIPLGRWVMNEACRTAMDLHRQGIEVPMAVNLSARQLGDPDWTAVVFDAVETAGLPPHALCLEITESVFVEDLDLLLGSFQSVREAGIGLHIDDFGTGYSSLAYLSKIPATGLKIDQSFVRDLDKNDGDLRIVQMITSLGLAMGLEVIAEGVETDAIARTLTDLGATTGQGYLWSRPLPYPELLPYLMAHSARK